MITALSLKAFVTNIKSDIKAKHIKVGNYHANMHCKDIL